MSSGKSTVFISYSHRDVKWKDQFVRHLRVLGDERDFDVWDDQRIRPGEDWRDAIERALVSAHVAVLLVSVDFLDSAFIRGVEIPKLLQRRQGEGLAVMPVIVRPCPWQHIPWLAAMQVRPRGGRALSGGSKHQIEAALARIAGEVNAALEQQKAVRAAAQPVEPVATAIAAPARSTPREPVAPAASASGLPDTGLDRGQDPVAPWTPASGVPSALSIPVAPPGATLHTFEFDTVRLGDQGQELERRKLSAWAFTEDLGGGATLEMVAVPGGTFTMGAPKKEADSKDNERPQRTVTLEPFFIGRFEVTQAQWRAVAAWPRVARDLPPDPAVFKGGERPVETVSWHDGVEFCARLKRKTGRSYRLPSEAEWEYAARAGTDTAFAFGPTITPAIVNYNGNFPYGGAAKGMDRKTTVEVGSLGVANRFGLFDMHGNVWEWTQDVWHDSYDGAPSDGRAWETGGDPARRVLRGGAWIFLAGYCRSAVRDWGRPESWGHVVGVRVVCAVSRTQS